CIEIGENLLEKAYLIPLTATYPLGKLRFSACLKHQAFVIILFKPGPSVCCHCLLEVNYDLPGI
ncbi:MAG: hypothetical protein AB1489_29395, partial [Acidobacteriota bacterium]